VLNDERLFYIVLANINRESSITRELKSEDSVLRKCKA